MLTRAIRGFPGTVIALVLSMAPSYANHAPDAKQKVVQARQRIAQPTRGARWQRYLHARSGHARSADYGAQEAGWSDAAGPATPTSGNAIESGIASWYGGRHQGRLTSSGRPFDQNALTAAHPWLPLGSKVRVRLVGSDRSVDVTITDRPGTRRRIIDLSRAAARELGMIHYGTALVTLSQN